MVKIKVTVDAGRVRVGDYYGETAELVTHENKKDGFVLRKEDGSYTYHTVDSVENIELVEE